jgi:hypothetical protein
MEAIVGADDCRRLNAAASRRRGAPLEHAYTGHGGAAAASVRDGQRADVAEAPRVRLF